MTARSSTIAPKASPRATLYREGMIAGLVGAVTVAFWFLVVDTANGRPLYTPSVLGTALFRSGAGAFPPVVVDLQMVVMFTFVHGLLFVVIGGLVAHLLGTVERHPHVGFGILLLFVFLEAGFVVAAMFFAEPILHALAWPAVLIANLLAATAMAAYFRLRHPNLRVEP